MEKTSDVLGLDAGRRRTLWWCAGLTAALLLAMVAGVGIGSVPIAPDDAVRVIARHTVGWPRQLGWSPSVDAIVWEVRLPRVLLGACVGAGLAVCGMALQAMVRNVLAEPYVLGISSGASCGAAAAILFGVGVGLGEHSLQTMAFLGALVASALVYGIARSGGRLTSMKLLLSGVAVGYALNALTGFLVFASGNAEGSRSVMFWLLGSLSLAGWGTPLAAVLVVTLVTVGLLAAQGRRLDLLAIGDETAGALGVSPGRLRAGLLLLVSLCIGVLVAASGSIGFVGLIVPHVARRCVGARHGRLAPVAALMGALLLVLADLVARTILQPQEIPLGILTALLGAPFLLILIRRLRESAA